MTYVTEDERVALPKPGRIRRPDANFAPQDPDKRPGVSHLKDLLDGIPSRPEWHSRAACSGNPEHFMALMFPPQGCNAADGARAVCATCPVQKECLLDAMENPGSDRAGIRAFTTVKQRIALRRRPDDFPPSSLFGMAGVWQQHLRSQGRAR